jgi:hypothetical protein
VPAADPPKIAYAAVTPVLEVQQAPVPLARAVRISSEAPSPAVSAADTQYQAHEELDRKAARAAIEADGYKSVTVLGKIASGAWRAKGFRGTTEVLLTVDGTGRVSMD